MSDTAALVDHDIRAQEATLFALCADLVAADSVSPPGRTAGVAAVVRDWLSAREVPIETLAADPDVPNIVATAAGAGAGKHVVFNAHMDTMEPGDEAQWIVPVFALTRQSGRAYGLGMGNMKGALAAMCLAVSAIHARRASIAGRLSLTAVSDEILFGERGAALLLRERPELAGDYLISGEGPGFMDLAVAEKGLLWLDVVARGEAGHSSRARAGETAVARLAALLAAVDAMNRDYAALPEALGGVSGGEDDEGFRLSVNPGVLAAGTVRSQVAPEATAALDIRLPPGLTADAVEDRIRRLAPPGVEIRRVKAWDANWTAVDHALARTVAGAAREVRGTAPRAVIRLPGSDARRWRDRGVPAICYGPQPTLSAGINDHVIEKDLVDCARVYAASALSLMAP